MSLIATGTTTDQALVAADLPSGAGASAEVVHVPTIKPLDHATVRAGVRTTGRAVTWRRRR